MLARVHISGMFFRDTYGSPENGKLHQGDGDVLSMLARSTHLNTSMVLSNYMLQEFAGFISAASHVPQN